MNKSKCDVILAGAFRRPKPVEQSAINKAWSAELQYQTRSSAGYFLFGIGAGFLVWLFYTFISCWVTDDMKYFTEMLPDYAVICFVAGVFFYAGYRARKRRARGLFLLEQLLSGNFSVMPATAVSVHKAWRRRSRKAHVVVKTDSGQQTYPIMYSTAASLLKSGVGKSEFPILLVLIDSARNGKCGAFYMR